MFKKLLLGVVLLVAAVAMGVFIWAWAVFSRDTVRTAIADQLSKAVGQPVTIQSVGVGIYPRVTLTLNEVAVGAPPRMTARRVDVGTEFWALLSRRIEHAHLRLSGARIDLPMKFVPVPVVQPGAAMGASSDLPVEIVSIDEVVLSNIELVSSGRTLYADVELVPQQQGFTIRSATLRAEEMQVALSGEISNIAGPVGELSIDAETLHLDALIAFAAQFTGGSGVGGGASAAPAGASAHVPMNVAIALTADTATLGSLALTNVAGRGRVTDAAVTLEPIAFALFGGKHDGTLSLTPAEPPRFTVKSAVSSMDVAEIMAFAGSPGTMTGQLSGTLALAGAGTAASAALQSTTGTARIDIVNGVVRNLGLVRAIVIAGSGRRDQPESAGAAAVQRQEPRDEPFSRIGATLTIANGVAGTDDLRFESNDLLMSAAGTIALDGTALDLAGQAQLSDALAQRAGRDLVRYTQVDGRPTLPIRITGPVANPTVSVDVGGVLQRAITNKAKEEIGGAIKRGLGGLIGR